MLIGGLGKFKALFCVSFNDVRIIDCITFIGRVIIK